MNLGEWRHICVDMQRLFHEDTPWHLPWMGRILPAVVAVSERHAGHSIFTRFVTPERADDVPGTWQQYYQKWWMMTRRHLAPELIGLVPELSRLVPPGIEFDKLTYSPWVDGRLHAHLSGSGVQTVIISGGETDVCVLATALGAIDHGYRVVLLEDAVCGSADETHDASLKLLGDRFSAQLEVMRAEKFLSLAG